MNNIKQQALRIHNGSGPTGNRTPTQNELEIARTQGRHVAQTALKLSTEPTPVAAE